MIDPYLSDDCRLELCTLLEEYTGLFDFGNHLLECTSTVYNTINTGK